MLKKALTWAAALLGLLFVIGAVIGGAKSISVPLAQADYKDCLQAAQAGKNAQPNCKATETLWDRGLSDPIAYYTLWLTFFTLALATVGIVQGVFIRQQMRLAQQEFIATHRPRIRVRLLAMKPEVVGEPLEFIFSLANIGDSPAKKVSYSISFFMPEINETPEIKWRGEGKGWYEEIAAGGQADVTHTTDFICPARHFVEYTGGRLTLSGNVGYLDNNGVFRMTSFKRRKGWQSLRFVQMDPIDSDFEYEG